MTRLYNYYPPRSGNPCGCGGTASSSLTRQRLSPSVYDSRPSHGGGSGHGGPTPGHGGGPGHGPYPPGHGGGPGYGPYPPGHGPYHPGWPYAPFFGPYSTLPVPIPIPIPGPPVQQGYVTVSINGGSLHPGITNAYTVNYQPGLNVYQALASTGVVQIAPNGTILSVSGVPVAGGVGYRIRLNGNIIASWQLNQPLQPGDTVSLELV
ncbi:hypothetical protein [Paenibacillus sp. HB172176]|uniref:hypothetical protein n=1 Tax=Paenibacillus sp. HB172176 TaxID=2493690 RepID=UPI00143C86EA|nr:hypothetical protein [Paenibacillus sp. HB172176]